MKNTHYFKNTNRPRIISRFFVLAVCTILSTIVAATECGPGTGISPTRNPSDLTAACPDQSTCIASTATGLYIFARIPGTNLWVDVALATGMDRTGNSGVADPYDCNDNDEESNDPEGLPDPIDGLDDLTSGTSGGFIWGGMTTIWSCSTEYRVSGGNLEVIHTCYAM